MQSLHVYKVRAKIIAASVQFRCAAIRLAWYDTPDNAIGYAMHYSLSHDAVIRVYDAAGNVIETHEHAGDLQRTVSRNPLALATRWLRGFVSRVGAPWAIMSGAASIPFMFAPLFNFFSAGFLFATLAYLSEDYGCSSK